MPNVAQRYPLNNATSTGSSSFVWDNLGLLRTSDNAGLQNPANPTAFQSNSAIVTLTSNGDTSQYLNITGFQFADGADPVPADADIVLR